LRIILFIKVEQAKPENIY